jgi:hypothetical protein
MLEEARHSTIKFSAIQPVSLRGGLSLRSVDEDEDDVCTPIPMPKVLFNLFHHEVVLTQVFLFSGRYFIDSLVSYKYYIIIHQRQKYLFPNSPNYTHPNNQPYSPATKLMWPTASLLLPCPTITTTTTPTMKFTH